MSFLVHSDEHGWLATFTRGYSASEVSRYGWVDKRTEAYRFASKREAQELKLPNVAVLHLEDA